MKPTLEQLYEALKARTQPGVRDMPTEDRQTYMRDAQRRSRERQRQSAAEGTPEPTASAVRQALSDAAMIILATGAPGSIEIQRLLGLAFPGRPGVPMTVASKARTGRLRPRMLTPDRLRPAE